MWSCYYRSQFNEIEKAWVQVKIICRDFVKTGEDKYITFETFFSCIYNNICFVKTGEDKYITFETFFSCIYNNICYDFIKGTDFFY